MATTESSQTQPKKASSGWFVLCIVFVVTMLAIGIGPAVLAMALAGLMLRKELDEIKYSKSYAFLGMYIAFLIVAAVILLVFTFLLDYFAFGATDTASSSISTSAVSIGIAELIVGIVIILYLWKAGKPKAVQKPSQKSAATK